MLKRGFCTRYLSLPRVCTLITLSLALVIVPATASARFTYLDTFGSFGQGTGQFNTPLSIALDKDTEESVYVADQFNSRIQRFDPGGEYVGMWGGQGPGSGPFNMITPFGVGTASKGRVLVSDWGQQRVSLFDREGNFLYMWGAGVKTGAQTLETCFANCRAGIRGSQPGFFSYPEGIAVAPMGNVFVADAGNHRIQKFTIDGQLLATWGSYGDGEGEFNNPKGITVDDFGEVIVADSYNHRIQKFDSNGNFLTAFGGLGKSEGRFTNPANVAADRLGNVYVVDSSNHRVQKLTSYGAHILTAGFGVKSGKSVFEQCERKCRQGNPGPAESQFSQPEGIAIRENDVAYISDKDNHRVQIFQLTPDDPKNLISPPSAPPQVPATTTVNQQTVQSELGLSLELVGKTNRLSAKRRYIKLRARCSKTPCSLTKLTGRVRVAPVRKEHSLNVRSTRLRIRRLRLQSTRGISLSATGQTELKLDYSKRAYELMRHALKRRKRLVVAIKGVARQGGKDIVATKKVKLVYRPALLLKGKRSQKLGRYVTLTAKCAQADCAFWGWAVAKLSGDHEARLGSVKIRNIERGRSKQIRLRIGRDAAKRINQALAAVGVIRVIAGGEYSSGAGRARAERWFDLSHS